MKRSKLGLKRYAGVLVIMALWMISPSSAGAEWFLEPYLGLAHTAQTDVDVSATGGGTALSGDFKDIDFDESLLVGLRTGRWLENVEYLGFALDLFLFQPDISSQTATFSGTGSVNVGGDVIVGAGSAQARLNSLNLKVIAISGDVMLRLLPADRTPTELGEIHAYVTAGPAIFLVNLEGQKDTVFGFKAGAGFSWLITPQTGFFFEYRLTHFSPDLEISSGGTKLNLDANIFTHHFIVGLTFRF